MYEYYNNHTKRLFRAA